MHSCFSYFSKKVTSLFLDGFIQVYTKFLCYFHEHRHYFVLPATAGAVLPISVPARVMSFIFWLSVFNYSSQHKGGDGEGLLTHNSTTTRDFQWLSKITLSCYQFPLSIRVKALQCKNLSTRKEKEELVLPTKRKHLIELMDIYTDP